MYYTSLDSGTIPQNEGAHPDAVFEYWYQNAIFETSDTPLSDWNMVSIILTVRPDSDDLVFVLFPPGREPISPTSRLEGERIQAVAVETDVRYGNHALRGRYPEYELFLDGVDPEKGTHYLLELKYVAQCVPVRLASWVPLRLISEEGGIQLGETGLQMWVGYRWGVTGSIAVDQQRYPVRGVAYLSHVWGILDPAGLMGWLWSSIPRADDRGLTINTEVFALRDGSFGERHFTFSLDGKSFGTFMDFEVEVLEKTEVAEGVERPTNVLYAGECEEGKVSMTLSLVPNPYLRTTGRGLRQSLFFIVPGFAEGFVEYRGEERKISGKSINGNVFMLGA